VNSPSRVLGAVKVRANLSWLACLFVGFLLLIPEQSTAQTGTIGLNFTGVRLSDGIALNGGPYAPPDNAGAVGPNNIVQLINGAYAVYDKTTGAQQQLISGRQFWTDAGFDPGNGIGGLGAFNDRIIYDPTVNRWIAAGLTADSTNNSIMIARSDSADPLGSWKTVAFLGNVGGEGKFVDYTMLGVDANGVYVSTNNFTSITGDYFDSSVFSLPKSDLLSTNPTINNLTRFDSVPSTMGVSIQPITDFGSAKNHAPLLATSINSNGTAVYRTDILGTAGAGATLSAATAIPVVLYRNPPLAAQPDGTRVISTISHRMSANVYQVGNTLYAVHSTRVGSNSGITWMMIDEQTNQVIQEGILSNPAFDYFQPSISANANGDIVISFTRSGFGAGGNLSAFAVVGKTLGASTTFGTPFLLKASPVGNYHPINNRWGDYMTTVLDPSNPNVFWTFQEFASDSSSWATQITQIIVPEPGSVFLAAIALAALMATVWRRQRRTLV